MEKEFRHQPGSEHLPITEVLRKHAKRLDREYVLVVRIRDHTVSKTSGQQGPDNDAVWNHREGLHVPAFVEDPFDSLLSPPTLW